MEITQHLLYLLFNSKLPCAIAILIILPLRHLLSPLKLLIFQRKGKRGWLSPTARYLLNRNSWELSKEPHVSYNGFKRLQKEGREFTQVLRPKVLRPDKLHSQGPLSPSLSRSPFASLEVAPRREGDPTGKRMPGTKTGMNPMPPRQLVRDIQWSRS